MQEKTNPVSSGKLKVKKMKKTIDYATYLDRILGGWIGKSLGGIVGAVVGYRLNVGKKKAS